MHAHSKSTISSRMLKDKAACPERRHGMAWPRVLHGTRASTVVTSDSFALEGRPASLVRATGHNSSSTGRRRVTSAFLTLTWPLRLHCSL